MRFIRLLGEVIARQFCFEINWPLPGWPVGTHCQLCMYHYVHICIHCNVEWELMKPYIVCTVNIKRSERELWKKEYHWPVLPFPLPLWVFLVDYSHTNLNWKQKRGSSRDSELNAWLGKLFYSTPAYLLLSSKSNCCLSLQLP